MTFLLSEQNQLATTQTSRGVLDYVTDNDELRWFGKGYHRRCTVLLSRVDKCALGIDEIQSLLDTRTWRVHFVEATERRLADSGREHPR